MQLSLFPQEQFKTYRLTETQPATAVWVHYIKATSEEEAIEKMYNGKILQSFYDIEPNEHELPTLESIEEIHNEEESK
jgi:hypothetical protein